MIFLHEKRIYENPERISGNIDTNWNKQKIQWGGRIEIQYAEPTVAVWKSIQFSYTQVMTN